MLPTQPKRVPIRFNREHFGYIVGFETGEIILTTADAENALHSGCTVDALKPYMLEEFEAGNGFHLQTPLLVWVELTRRCNLACQHCYIDAGRAREDEFDENAFVRLIDEMAEAGVWAIALTGGEPTLHPGFARIVNHARSLGLLVGVATNGMFLTEDLLNSLPRDGVIISVSIDDLHLAANTPGAEFAAAAKSILRCKAMGFLTNIMTNTHRNNLSGLTALMDWAEDNGVSIRSVPFSPLGRGKQFSELENSINDVDEAAKFWVRECEWEHEYHKQSGLCVGVIFNYGLSFAAMTRRCSSGRYLCYVCSDGTVYPCTMCAGEQLLSPGSVRNRGFVDLWRSGWQIRDYNWDNFANACNGCPISDEDAYYCASRCPALSFARHGTFFECGASDFQILSTIKRTALINSTEAGKRSGIAVSKLRAASPESHDQIPQKQEDL